MKYISLFTIFSYIFYSTSFSQTINGHWFGIGKVQLPGTHDQYLTELVLRQKKKKVKGEFLYYFRDSLFNTPIEGAFDSVSRKLTLNKLPVIFYASKNPNYGIDCIMSGDFILRTSKLESLLFGSFIPDEAHKYGTPPINFNLIRSNDTAQLLKAKEFDSTFLKNVNITDAFSEIPENREFNQREKKITKEIEVKSSTIQLELFDNGEIDNDSVTVFVNNKLVLPKTMLSYNAIKLSIQLDELLEFNEISMFANNLGIIPPNTAVMILYDGKTRYEVQMSSNLNETATIRLKKKK
jgi:hypothetical protein